MPQELRSRRNRVVVECRKVEASAVARPEIFISPLHADSVGVGAVLVHELIHAAHPDAGHRGVFRRAALALGLTGRMTAITPGDQLRHDLVALIERIGQPYPRRRPGQCAARLRRCGESISTYRPAITVPSRSRSRWNVSSTREELS